MHAVTNVVLYFAMNEGEMQAVRTTLNNLATEYFDRLAEWFPVMCASDEFHFLPRSQAAAGYYHRLDSLNKESVDERIATLKKFRGKLELLGGHEADLDQQIDIELLRASIAGLLTELEITQTYRHNPLLYLKIAFIGLDHCLTKPADSTEQRMEWLRSRLSVVPEILRQAAANMLCVPETYHRSAWNMLADCKLFLHEIEQHLPPKQLPHLKGLLGEVHSALVRLREFLKATAPVPDQTLTPANLDSILRARFVSIRSPAEIYAVAVEEWSENMEQLRRLQAAIDPGKSWLELYHEYLPPGIGQLDTLSLYRREIADLREFFRRNGFGQIALQGLPEISETPTYLRSVRSSASFSAAFSSDPRETDYFYVTTQPLPDRSTQGQELLRGRLHREYQFLTAHETFPGHYLLDSTRRKLANPIRRQIESPLFYEGWAYYVESLLIEYGYIDSPIAQLVDCKRRLWRAARCRIDVGLTTDTTSLEACLGLLKTVGFTEEEAKTQITRFRMNPGYQLCYSLGRYELMKLREKHAPKIGLDRFHAEVLAGGQLPFHLIDKRFEKLDKMAQDTERKEH